MSIDLQQGLAGQSALDCLLSARNGSPNLHFLYTLSCKLLTALLRRVLEFFFCPRRSMHLFCDSASFFLINFPAFDEFLGNKILCFIFSVFIVYFWTHFLWPLISDWLYLSVRNSFASWLVRKYFLLFPLLTKVSIEISEYSSIACNKFYIL